MKRFGVSLEDKLLFEFDNYIKMKGFNNRSMAIAELIREELVKHEWQKNCNVAGAILCVYDHHKRELVEKIISLQHDFTDIIISTQHIHLDHNNCLEIIAVKGKANKVKKLSETLKLIKGVKHLNLSMSTTGEKIV
jgi:CopG family nickel-responsive transcriptional regulator